VVSLLESAYEGGVSSAGGAEAEGGDDEGDEDKEEAAGIAAVASLMLARIRWVC
jgi:hypothetical protein